MPPTLRLVAALAFAGVAFFPAGRAAAQAPSAAQPSVLSLPSGPGSVRGLADEASLDAFNAQVGYTVPIAAPTSGALAPQLAITYNGALGNGPLGIGWSLPLPSIRRSLRHGVPAYDDSDELELVGIAGGGRLARISGGVYDGEYRVEGKGNAIRVQRAGGGWKVSDPDGNVYLLGVQAEDRLADGARIAAWHLESVRDLGCAEMTFAYVTHRGEVYLDSIEWGPERPGLGRVYRVYVEHEERPDTVIRWSTGFRVETARRVARIRVESFGETRATYHLSYDEGGALSRLASVRVTGRGGDGELPITRFGYAAREAAGTAALAGTGGWTLGERGVVFSDVDGDGVDDLLRLEAGNHVYRRNLGGDFGDAVALAGADAVDLEGSALIDLDGDARAELVRIVDDRWRAYRLDGTTWTALGEWPGTEGLPVRPGPDGVLVDLDGDGRTDVLRPTASGVLVNLGGPTGMGPEALLPAVSAVDPPVEPGAPAVRVLEVNGDGLADVVWLTDAWMKVFLGRGDGTFELFDRVFYPWGPDGADDALDLDDLHLADLDRDGLIDLVRVSAAHVLVYLGRGDHRFTVVPRHVPRPEASSADATVAIADADGDGAADVVWSSPRGMWALDLAGASSAGMIASIDNGLGTTSRFTYETSGRLAVAAAAAGDPWARSLPRAIPVVVRVDTEYADGAPTRVVHHGVRDGFWDPAERRFGGFLVTRRVLPAPTAAEVRVEETRHLPGTGADCALRGLTWYHRVEDGLGRVYSVAESAWSTLAVSGLPDTACLRVAIQTEARTHLFEGVDEPLETLVEYAHDDQGRIVEERSSGRLDLDGDESITRRTYASQTSPWIRDRVVESDLLAWDETVVSRTRSFYGDEDGGDQSGGLGNGWLTSSWGLLVEDSGSRWVRLSEVGYDTCGNAETTYRDGVDRTVGYDELALHPVSETVVPASGTSLTWSATWDRVLGVTVAFTDPNGDTGEVDHDALGRPIAFGLAGAPRDTRVVYDWAPPRSRTTSYVFDGPAEDLPALADAWTSGAPWRETIQVSASDGSAHHTATRLGDRWLIGGWVERDARGRVVTVAEAWEATTWPDVRPPEVPVQTLRHDALDRVVEERLASGEATTWSYDAACQTVTAPTMAPVTSCRDGLGRTIHTERPVGVLESVDAIYDAAGRLVIQQLQGGEVTRAFTYDTLGRLVAADDPDLGTRTFAHDDGGRVTAIVNGAGQTLDFEYDGAGRLTRRGAGDGTELRFHYDTPFAGGAAGPRTAGRLAWIEEPLGRAEVAYDARGRIVRSSRVVDGVEAIAEFTFSPSGLVLERTWDDGLSVDAAYDAAGRVIRLGEVWEALELDAAGRVLEERYGNGVVRQTSYDVNGQSDHVTMRRGTASPIYDVAIARNGVGAITEVADLDLVGRDQNASFTYDGGARLVGATLGSGAGAYQLGYAYDGLQNMTERTVTGPQALGVLAGTYVYGRRGAGPRQLSAVVDPGGAVHRMTYDAAGRQLTDGDRTMHYDGLDQLVEVELPGGTVEHAYGHDGQRVLTRDPTGDVERWFSADLRQRGAQREHYLSVGDRMVARISLHDPAAGGGGSGGVVVPFDADPRPLARGVTIALALAFLALLVRGARRGRRFTATVAALVATALLAPGCAFFSESSRPAWIHDETLYLHDGVGVGPMIVARDDGSIVEERRHEPFGAPIEADYTIEPHNSLNKPTDPTTGWSYHGARWMASSSGRWLTPDPPIKAPDASTMERPWDLHPYKYGRQNPTVYWDPDGRNEEAAKGVMAAGATVCGASGGTLCEVAIPVAAGIAVVVLLWEPASDLGDAIGDAIWGGDYKLIPTTKIDLKPKARNAPKKEPKPAPEPEPRTTDIAPAPDTDTDPDDDDRSEENYYYVTYTKVNSETGQVYSGRSQGYGSPEFIVALRDMGHHIDGPGWEPAVLANYAIATQYPGLYETDPAYWAIRGREQQLIDAHGGAQSDGGASGNKIRGVGKDNAMGQTYHAYSNIYFGPLSDYTGN